jgi:serine/threonine protein kinase
LPPFYYKSPVEVYEAIRFKNPNFYKFHSSDAVDLLSKLLNKNPEQRLGSKYGA